MRHHATPEFWDAYKAVPDEVQRLADRCYALLKADPRHPSLHFKKVGSYWSARVGTHYRVLAIQEDEDFAWFWIGRHDEYDRLIGNR